MFVNQNSRRGMWGHKGYQSVDIIWPRVFMNSLINSFKWGQLTAFSHGPNLSPTTALATLNGWLIYLLEIPKVHAAVILRTLHDIDKLNSRSVQDIHCIEGFRWFFSISWQKICDHGENLGNLFRSQSSKFNQGSIRKLVRAQMAILLNSCTVNYRNGNYAICFNSHTRSVK